MKKIDRDTMYVGQEVIYYYPRLGQYFYTKIVSIWTMGPHWEVFVEFVKIGATTGTLPVSTNQLYYNNPENKTEAILRGITIRPQSAL